MTPTFRVIARSALSALALALLLGRPPVPTLAPHPPTPTSDPVRTFHLQLAARDACQHQVSLLLGRPRPHRFGPIVIQDIDPRFHCYQIASYIDVPHFPGPFTRTYFQCQVCCLERGECTQPAVTFQPKETLP